MIKFTWLGTATIKLDIEGEKLLFDPFFRMNDKLEKPELKEFCEVDYIFNTHPHLDHACDLPLILKNSGATLYAPKQTSICLKKLGASDKEKIKIIRPGDTIKTENTSIIVHKSKHIKFDFILILHTIFRSLFKLQFSKAIKLLKLNNKFKMKGEIYAYEISALNKKIFLMGSAGNIKNSYIPKDIDILFLPYQGKSNICGYSFKLVEKIKPKTIVLTHFDNAYPPITTEINTEKFISKMKEKQPETTVIEPKFNKEIEL